MPRFKTAFVAIALGAAAIATAAVAAETVVMTATDANGAAITFSFDKEANPRLLVVRTKGAGVAYSAFSIFVDKSTTPTYRHIFSASECAYPDGGPSECTLTIPQSDAAYGDIVAIFKAGKEARIVVEHANAMAMDHTASLIGFTKSFDE